MRQLPRDLSGFCPLGPDLAATVPPDSVIFDGADPVTAAMVSGRIRHFASALAQAGLRAEMRIGLHLPAGSERLAVTLAVTALGAVAVPLDPALGQARLTIARQGAELDMVVEGGVALPATARAGLKLVKINDLTPAPLPRALPRPQAGQAGVVLFGQGARDSGRAVVLSHGALHSAAIGLIRRFGLTTGLRVHVPLSFNHAPRLVAELACLISGATLTEQAQGADLALVIDTTPQFGPEDAPKTIVLSAPPREMRALTRRFPASRIFNAYARAEICGLALTSDPRDPAHAAITTVGRPLPGVEVMIVDPRTGFDMLLYEIGEIWLRGPAVMSSYDHAPRASAQAVDATGFFHTGDMGYLDSEGRVILAVNHAQI